MTVRGRTHACEKAIWARDEIWLKHCAPLVDAARKNGDLTARPRLVRLILIVLRSEATVLIGIRSHMIWYLAFSHYLTEEGQAFLVQNRDASAEVAAALLRGPRSGDKRKDTYRYKQAMMLVLVLKDEKLLPYVRKVVEAAREDHDNWWLVERYGVHVETALKQGWKIPWGRPVWPPSPAGDERD